MAEQTVNSAAELVNKLGDRSKEIGQIVGLFLAGRAGDHGHPVFFGPCRYKVRRATDAADKRLLHNKPAIAQGLDIQERKPGELSKTRKAG